MDCPNNSSARQANCYYIWVKDKATDTLIRLGVFSRASDKGPELAPFNGRLFKYGLPYGKDKQAGG